MKIGQGTLTVLDGTVDGGGWVELLAAYAPMAKVSGRLVANAASAEGVDTAFADSLEAAAGEALASMDATDLVRIAANDETITGVRIVFVNHNARGGLTLFSVHVTGDTNANALFGSNVEPFQLGDRFYLVVQAPGSSPVLNTTAIFLGDNDDQREGVELTPGQISGLTRLHTS